MKIRSVRDDDTSFEAKEQELYRVWAAIQSTDFTVQSTDFSTEALGSRLSTQSSRLIFQQRVFQSTDGQDQSTDLGRLILERI